MKTILKILAALMLLTGSYHADSLNAQEHAATDSITADIMRIKDEMLVVCDTTTNFMFSGDDKLTEADPHAYWLMSRMMETMTMIQYADDGLAWEMFGEAYREMTAKVTSRLYEELKELRKIRY